MGSCEDSAAPCPAQQCCTSHCIELRLRACRAAQAKSPILRCSPTGLIRAHQRLQCHCTRPLVLQGADMLPLVQGLAMEVGDEGLTAEQQRTLKAIRHRKKQVVADHRSRKAVANNQAILPRKADRDRKSNTTNMKVRLQCALIGSQQSLSGALRSGQKCSSAQEVESLCKSGTAECSGPCLLTASCWVD